MTAEIWGLIPLKALNFAKQRLTPALSPDERRGLFLAMVNDVLATMRGAHRIGRVLIVTKDRDAYRSLADDDVELLAERTAGLSRAVADAARHAAARGAEGIVVVPGDLPLLAPEDIDAMTAHLDRGPVVAIAPDVDEDGTNCIAVSPPDLMSYHFGRGSFHRHRDAARECGVEPALERRPGLAFDVDTVEDLVWLLESLDDAPHNRTRAYLLGSDLASRLGRPHNTRSLGSKA